MYKTAVHIPATLDHPVKGLPGQQPAHPHDDLFNSAVRQIAPSVQRFGNHNLGAIILQFTKQRVVRQRIAGKYIDIHTLMDFGILRDKPLQASSVVLPNLGNT